jgi:hypothetical protein
MMHERKVINMKKKQESKHQQPLKMRNQNIQHYRVPRSIISKETESHQSAK